MITSSPLHWKILAPRSPALQDRYEFGVFLVDLLKPYDPHQISYNPGLWSWLAALFFEQLAPVDADGKRALRRPYVYVLSENRLYYRHLVRGPWNLVRTHGAEARYLLSPIRVDDPAPLLARVTCSTNWRPGSSSFPVRHLLLPRGAYSPILGRAAKAGSRREGERLPPTPRADREPIGSDLRHPQHVG